MFKLKDILNENSNKAKLYKLYTKAMKMMPGSPAQKKIKKEIDELRKKLGLKEMIPVLPRINMGFGQAQDYASMMIKKSGDIIRFTKAGNMGKAKKTIKDMEKIVKQIKRVLG